MGGLFSSLFTAGPNKTDFAVQHDIPVALPSKDERADHLHSEEDDSEKEMDDEKVVCLAKGNTRKQPGG